MILRALWSPLFDSHVELTAEQRRLVLLRARQTADLTRVIGRVQGFTRPWLLKKLWKFRIAYGVFVACLFLLRFFQTGLGGAFRSILLMHVWLAVASLVVMLFYFIPGWIARPWLVEHVRRAICDFGYDEICYRCGYRLRDIPWEVVQCSECGAVRARPRVISDQERTALDPTVVVEEPDLVDQIPL